jgi:hypothetical protein
LQASEIKKILKDKLKIAQINDSLKIDSLWGGGVQLEKCSTRGGSEHRIACKDGVMSKCVDVSITSNWDPRRGRANTISPPRPDNLPGNGGLNDAVNQAINSQRSGVLENMDITLDINNSLDYEFAQDINRYNKDSRKYKRIVNAKRETLGSRNDQRAPNGIQLRDLYDNTV